MQSSSRASVRPRPEPSTHRRPTASRRSRTIGQGLVEFALIVPVMLLLLTATVDLGRLFYSRITVSDAARAGAMEAAENPNSFQPNTACTSANKDVNRVMCRVLQEANGSFVTIAPADVAVTCSGGCGSNATLGATVSVQVTGHFTLVTPIIGSFIGGQNLTFSSTASAQRQVPPNTVVTAPPVASFNASPLSGPAPLTVTLSNTTTGAATNWAWTFGDGQASSLQTPPPHTYATPGTYTITLVASNAGGSSSYNLVVNATVPAPTIPVASFTATPMTGAAPLNVSFSDTSTGAPTSWAWTFGDGGTSSQQNPPSHTYLGVGSYTVTLTVTNAAGSSSASKTINAGVACLAPVANFTVTPTSGQKNATNFDVTDTSTNMGTAGCNNTWSWNFGDGTGISTQQDPPLHKYTKKGTYQIQLSVANSVGSSTHSVTVTVSN